MKLLIVAWIQIYSSFFGVDPYFVEAIVQQESMYNANATGAASEVGLMQIKREYLDFPDEYYNPRLNLFVGVKRLSELKRLRSKLGQNWFCAWNLGPTGALRLHREGTLSKFKYCRQVRLRKEKLQRNKISKY